MRSALLLSLCLLSGCYNIPKQMHYGPYRYAYWWTFANGVKTPEQDTEARRLWQNYLEAQVAWEWAWYNPPSVTGFTNGEEWIAEARKHEADRQVFKFLKTLE